MIENFRQKVEETINFLPPMPVVMTELIDVLHSDTADFRTIGNIISKDPSMTMNVLKIANSAFYGLPYNVTTVEQAMRMLGINEIASLCISCATNRSLKAPPGVKTVDFEAFWKHSVATGVFGKILSRTLNIRRGENLYLAGLVHDVGVVILDRFKHEVYNEIVDLTFKENIPILEAEQRVMGASHDTVGGWLMEKWKLPEVFLDVTRYHHNVNDAPEKNKVVVALISLADQLARLKEHGFGGDMNGVVISDTDAFIILEKKNPDIADLDVVKFIWDLDSANAEIEEMEKMIING
jgi:HD-like signal output (HDOD) protein